MRTSLLPSCALAFLCILSCRAASGPALNFNPYSGSHEYYLSGTNGMYGWMFRVSQPVTVTGIGWFDDSSDGLSHSHQVGIWPANLDLFQIYSNLLTSVTVPSGITAPLDGYYRKVELPQALTLQAGDYCVAGTYEYQNQDNVNFLRQDNPPPGDWRFELGGPADSFGGFRPPNQIMLVYGVLLGPMLYVEQVPEPCAAALVAIAFLAVTLRRIRLARSISDSKQATSEK